MEPLLNNSVEVSSQFDYQILIDAFVPYFLAIVIALGIVIGLLIVLLFAKGWQSNAR